jgi:hypothetical protein
MGIPYRGEEQLRVFAFYSPFEILLPEAGIVKRGRKSPKKGISAGKIRLPSCLQTHCNPQFNGIRIATLFLWPGRMPVLPPGIVHFPVSWYIESVSFLRIESKSL